MAIVLCLWFIAARLCCYALTMSVRRTSVRLLSVMCTLFFSIVIFSWVVDGRERNVQSILLMNEVIVKYVSGK